MQQTKTDDLSDLEIPPELDKFAARMRLSLPDRKQVAAIIHEEAKRWLQANRNKRLTVDRSLFDQLVTVLQGLPETNARQLAQQKDSRSETLRPF